MKHLVPLLRLILVLLIDLVPLLLFSEGTKEIMPIPANPASLCIDPTRNPFAIYNGNPDYRLYISVKDFTREEICFGLGAISAGTLTWRIHDPLGNVVATGPVPTVGQPGYINTYAQAIAGPNVISPGGYNPLSVVPAMNGDYFLTFQYPGAGGERDFDFFDITVVDMISHTGFTGRIFSKAWQFWTIIGMNNYQPYWGKMFIYSKDSIITQFDPNGFDGREFSFASNESGCFPIGPGHPPAEARQSRDGEFTYPEYKIFLNDPDPILYPSGVLGGFDTTYPVHVTPDCQGADDFSFRVTKAGNVEIHLLLSALGAPYVDRIIPSPVGCGIDTVRWDGYDGATPAHLIPNGSSFFYYITYLNGLTHLPLFDVENNVNGFRLALIRPTSVPPPPAPLFYWDDSQIWAPNVNLTGCLPTPFTGCHLWELFVHNYDHNQTVNTWWYVLSMSTRPALMTQSMDATYNHAATLCSGDSIFIDGTWVKTAGIYKETLTGTFGCDSVNQWTITVNPSPVVNLGPDVQICQGQTHTFDAGAGAGCTYSWDNLTTHTYGIGNGRFYTTGTTGLYKVTVTNTANCRRADSALLTVNPVPTVTTTPLNEMICSGATTSIQLTSNVPGTIFSWTANASSALVTGYTGGSGSSIIQTLANASNLLQTVTYHITPVSNGCAGNQADFIVSVNAIPNVTFQPPAQSICSGQTTSVNFVSTTPGTTYTWAPVQTFGNPGVQGQTPGSGNVLLQTLFTTGLNPGNVTYQVEPSISGCPGIPNNVLITVNPVPVTTFTACFDNPTQTDAQPIRLRGGIPLQGAYSGPGVTGAGYFDPGAAGAGNHTITYTYTNSYGCSSQATQTIRVMAIGGPFICGTRLTDIRDNQTYPTVQIGAQCWMASNLNYGNYIVSSSMQRDNCIPEKYCYQDNLGACAGKGALYQWDELMRYQNTEGVQGMCPPGWHIPTENDWNTLFAVYLNSAYAGADLKYTGNSGFNAGFPGQRFINRSWSFSAFATHFWSSTSPSAFKAWAHAMNSIDPGVAWYPAYRMNAFPVRCLKD